MDYLNFSLFLFYGAVVYIGKSINMLDFIPLGIYRKYYRQHLGLNDLIDVGEHSDF